MVGAMFIGVNRVATAKYNTGKDHDLVSANGIIIDPELSHDALSRSIFEQFEEYTQPYKTRQSNAKELIGSAVISPPKELTKDWSIEDWQKIERDVFFKMGIDLEKVPYYSLRHNDTAIPHTHITVSCVDFEGNRAIKSSMIGEKIGKACDKVAKERGWKTAKEIKAEKLSFIGSRVSANFERSGNLEEFIANMRKDDLLVKTSEKQGEVYGLRIIPADEFDPSPSPRKEATGQGYKFSEIPTGQGKAKFKTIDFLRDLQAKGQAVKFTEADLLKANEKLYKVLSEQRVQSLMVLGSRDRVLADNRAIRAGTFDKSTVNDRMKEVNRLIKLLGGEPYEKQAEQAKAAQENPYSRFSDLQQNRENREKEREQENRDFGLGF